jgi:hypothetical protein
VSKKLTPPIVSSLDRFVGSIQVDGTDHFEEARTAAEGHGARADAQNDESGIA